MKRFLAKEGLAPMAAKHNVYSKYQGREIIALDATVDNFGFANDSQGIYREHVDALPSKYKSKYMNCFTTDTNLVACAVHMQYPP